MGSPHSTDICEACHEPIVQWNNTGAWEHLGSATMDQAKSRAYLANAKVTGEDHTVCSSPKLKIEQTTVSSRTTGNYRTAKKTAR